MKAKLWWVLVAFVCIGLVIGANVMRQGQETDPVVGPEIATLEDTVEQRPPVETPSLAEALGVSEDDMVEVGGVKRPKRDLSTVKINQDAERRRYLASLPKVGNAPSVADDENPTAAKLAKEMLESKGLRRYSSALAKTEPFDRAMYLADPESYLKLTRPGRVFQAAAPGKGVSQLESSSPMYLEILQGDSVFLEAKVEPGMPVTFHTQQLGEFSNRLKTISVAASAEGLAKTKYTAVSGVKGSVRIMASSPVHSGRLVYMVNVSVPN